MAAAACCDPLPLNARDVDVADGRNGTARTAAAERALHEQTPNLRVAGRRKNADGVQYIRMKNCVRTRALHVQPMAEDLMARLFLTFS